MAVRRRVDWHKVAENVAAAIPIARLDRAVVAWTKQPAASRRTWHVAVSGGADSVAVLLLLWALWPKQRSRFCVLHFNHRLRGPASSGDADFCRRICAALGVRFILGRWDRPASTRRPSEAEARTARHAFFERHARVLWLGHHADDVAETMLMRLARGSGAGGLSAPRPVQVHDRRRVYLRPLLGLRKSEVTAALRAAGAIWREDATNGTADYFRNRVRSAVIPAWVEASQRDAISGAVRARELLAEDDAAIESWVNDLRAIGKSRDLLVSRLRGMPRAVVRRALHRFLLQSPSKIDVSRQAFEALLSAVEAGRPTRHSLGREVFGVIRNGRLRLETGKPDAKFQRRVN